MYLAGSGLSCSVGIFVASYGIFSCGVWAWLPCSRRDLSLPARYRTHLPALQGRFLTTGPPGNSSFKKKKKSIFFFFSGFNKIKLINNFLLRKSHLIGRQFVILHKVCLFCKHGNPILNEICKHIKLCC